MALIELRDVKRRYRMGGEEVYALNGVDLDIEEGEFVAIMGTSGSGKSTMMNLVGCLDRPSSGSYTLAGYEVAKLDTDALAGVRNRLLGFVFQNFNLLPRTSALENVELPLIYAGVPVRERHARAKEALERVQLGSRLDHTPAQLSGGQQQRVAIARALVSRPRLLLADEPTGNLDSATTAAVMELLRELNDGGQTVVFVTHEHDVAAYARRVITMRDGKVLSDVRQTATTVPA
jgi:putative ABC transport system ATP-binding protein